MPLTELRNSSQVWPPIPGYAPPISMPPAIAPTVNHENTEASNQVRQLAQETAVRFEALRRILQLDEGEILATEKAILQERQGRGSGIGENEVLAIVQGAIEKNNDVIRDMLEGIVNSIKSPPVSATNLEPSPAPDMPEGEAPPNYGIVTPDTSGRGPNWRPKKK